MEDLKKNAPSVDGGCTHKKENESSTSLKGDREHLVPGNTLRYGWDLSLMFEDPTLHSNESL